MTLSCQGRNPIWYHRSTQEAEQLEAEAWIRIWTAGQKSISEQPFLKWKCQTQSCIWQKSTMQIYLVLTVFLSNCRKCTLFCVALELMESCHTLFQLRCFISSVVLQGRILLHNNTKIWVQKPSCCNRKKSYDKIRMW